MVCTNVLYGSQNRGASSAGSLEEAVGWAASGDIVDLGEQERRDRASQVGDPHLQ